MAAKKVWIVTVDDGNEIHELRIDAQNEQEARNQARGEVRGVVRTAHLLESVETGEPIKPKDLDAST